MIAMQKNKTKQNKTPKNQSTKTKPKQKTLTLKEDSIPETGKRVKDMPTPTVRSPQKCQANSHNLYAEDLVLSFRPCQYCFSLCEPM